jgi:hypothetical protein
MQFEAPQSLSHLEQILRGMRIELKRTRGSLQTSGGVTTVQLIRNAHEYANDDAADRSNRNAEARAVETLAAVQRMAEALQAAEAQVAELVTHMRRANIAMVERDARYAARSTESRKYRV